MIQIILLSGYSGSGKSLTSQIISDHIKSKYPNHPNPVQLISFSYPIKQHAANMLNGLLNPVEKFDATLMNNLEYKEKTWNYKFMGNPLRIRDVLIHIGEGFRTIDENVWVDIAINRIKKILDDACYDLNVAPIYYIIDDNRHINEVASMIGISERLDNFPANVFGISLSRNTSIQQAGSTEKSTMKLAHEYPDYIYNISNDDSIDNLKNSVLEIINKNSKHFNMDSNVSRSAASFTELFDKMCMEFNEIDVIRTIIDDDNENIQQE